MVDGINTEHFLIRAGEIDVGNELGTHVGIIGTKVYELGIVTELGNQFGQVSVGVYVGAGVIYSK